MLCSLVLDDLLEVGPVIREQARRGLIGYGINFRYRSPTTSKEKSLDLAIGRLGDRAPADPAGGRPIQPVKTFGQLLVACEAKAVMTEHSKSQPRVYDELSSSHEIIHQAEPSAIAAGITVVNISDTFVSPLRQTTTEVVHASQHQQPRAARRMVEHLRGLPVRSQIGAVGFDAYCTFVITCDNVSTVRLWDDLPAPQPGDPDHYDTFISRIAAAYQERFTGIG
jgi:hypothetical protein